MSAALHIVQAIIPTCFRRCQDIAVQLKNFYLAFLVFIGDMLVMNRFVGNMVEWLKHCGGDQHGHDSKPTRAILLCAWERHFTTLSPVWWSWQVVLNFSHISKKLKNQIKNFNRTAISWHLRKFCV